MELVFWQKQDFGAQGFSRHRQEQSYTNGLSVFDTGLKD